MNSKKKKRTIEWLLKKYLSFFEKFGMTKENIVNHYEEWRLNRADIIEDYLWYIFNFLLNENAKQSKDITSFYKRNYEIYMQMLYLRRKIEGKPANEIQQALNYNRLGLNIETTPYEFDVIVIATSDCKACKNIDGKIFTVEKALEDKIIPYNHCERKQGCACTYGFRLRRGGENDRLIRK